MIELMIWWNDGIETWRRRRWRKILIRRKIKSPKQPFNIFKCLKCNNKSRNCEIYRKRLTCHSRLLPMRSENIWANKQSHQINHGIFRTFTPNQLRCSNFGVSNLHYPVQYPNLSCLHVMQKEMNEKKTSSSSSDDDTDKRQNVYISRVAESQ